MYKDINISFQLEGWYPFVISVWVLVLEAHLLPIEN